MHQLLESMLKKEIIMNPYDSLFEKNNDSSSSDEENKEEEELINLRKFLDVAIIRYNNNEPVDVDSIAEQLGADF